MTAAELSDVFEVRVGGEKRFAIHPVVGERISLGNYDRDHPGCFDAANAREVYGVYFGFLENLSGEKRHFFVEQRGETVLAYSSWNQFCLLKWAYEDDEGTCGSYVDVAFVGVVPPGKDRTHACELIHTAEAKVKSAFEESLARIHGSFGR